MKSASWQNTSRVTYQEWDYTGRDSARSRKSVECSTRRNKVQTLSPRSTDEIKSFLQRSRQNRLNRSSWQQSLEQTGVLLNDIVVDSQNANSATEQNPDKREEPEITTNDAEIVTDRITRAKQNFRQISPVREVTEFSGPAFSFFRDIDFEPSWRLESPYLNLFPSEAYLRFKKTVRALTCWLYFYWHHSSQVKTVLRYFGNLEGIIENANSSFLFAVSTFQVNKQAMVNRTTIASLRSPPLSRTEEQCSIIESGLHGYSWISEYPKDIIKELSKKAWYQEFEPGSIIIREGDLPLYFYFILSGKVMVSVIDKQQMTARTVCNLTRGDSFGELSIVDRTVRKSTVITTEQTGLLIVEDNDYMDIFMHGGVRFVDDPFLKTVTCLKNFPLDELKKNSKHVKFSYFKPGTILVEDSKLSQWIFIIKSGSCHAMMPLSKSKEYNNTLPPGKLYKKKQRKPDKPSHVSLVRRGYREHLKNLVNQNAMLRKIQPTDVGVPISTENFNSELSAIGREATHVNEKGSYFKTFGVRFVSNVTSAKNASDGTGSKKQDDVRFWKDNETVQGKRTLATDLNKEYYHEKSLMPPMIAMTNCEMVTLQVLTPGMAFGLIDHFFDNQPSLKLVSKGCECFVIQKDLYHDSIPQLMLNEIGMAFRPYPNLEAVSKNRAAHLRWNVAKQCVLDHTLFTLRKETVNVHNARSVWPSAPKLPPIASNANCTN